MNHMNQASHCNCSHHKIGPSIIILIGLSFLLGHLGIIGQMEYSVAWPSLLILWGIVKLISGGCKCYMQG